MATPCWHYVFILFPLAHAMLLPPPLNSSIDCVIPVYVTADGPVPPHPGNKDPTWTLTSYTTTATANSGVECHGCSLVTETRYLDYAYPEGSTPSQSISILTASTPTTRSEFYCLASGLEISGLTDIPTATASPAPSASSQTAALLEVGPDRWNNVTLPDLAANSDCTSSIKEPMSFFTDLDSFTKTEFTSTVTSTAGVDCGECNHVRVMQRSMPDHGPYRHWTTTVTVANPTTVTEFACNNATPTSTATPVTPSSWMPPFLPTDAPMGSVLAKNKVPRGAAGDEDEPSAEKLTILVPGFPHEMRSSQTSTMSLVTRDVDAFVVAAKKPSVTEKITADTITATATSTSTQTSTITTTAEPTTTDPLEPFKLSTVFPKGVKSPDCTTTRTVDFLQPGKTLTMYTTSITAKVTINCGSCALAWKTGVSDFFEPISYDATTTAKTPSVLTAFACQTAFPPA